VRQVLTYVVTGNVDAGIDYATVAQTSKQVRIVPTVPEGFHLPIVYPVALIKTLSRFFSARKSAPSLRNAELLE
jgi:molybdate transport system substrate-binding protein